MIHNLENCLFEIISELVGLLDLEDIGHLRLTCKSLGAKCLNSHYESFFHLKSVDMTENALQKLTDGVRVGGLPCLIRHLTINGIATIPEGSEPDMRNRNELRTRESQLLTNAFDALAQHGNNRRLTSLSLRVAVVIETGKRITPAEVDASLDTSGLKQIWKTTADTYATAMRALSASKLQIESLNIYNGSDQQQCSLASDQLHAGNWEVSGLKECLTPLKTLSISLSNRDLGVYRERLEAAIESDRDAASFGNDSLIERRVQIETEAQAKADDEENFNGLSKVFTMCNNIENFELHYVIWSSGLPSGISYSHERILQGVSEPERLPSLKRCSLRGVQASEANLLYLIQKAEVRDLTLETIYLSTGTFRPIFDYCTMASTNLIRLYFDALYEGDFQIAFFGLGDAMLPGGNVEEDFDETLIREGEEVKHHIVYDMTPLRSRGTPVFADWLRRQRKEFGPI